MKQNPTIYKIDEVHDMDSVVEGITTHLSLNNKTPIIRDVTLNEYLAKLIVIQSSTKESEWSDFFPNEFTEGIILDYQMPSLLLLIDTPSGIFSILGGSFFKYILPFLDTSYGLNTYSRIMNPVQDEIISITTRGVTGLRAGMSEHFKDNYRIMDYIKFGKIPTEIKIKLSSDIVDLLFNLFVSPRSPSIVLNISTGFNLNKKLNFIELGLLTEILEHIETLPANDFFSSYKEITNDNIIRNSLKPALINELYNRRAVIIANKVSNFDICYPNKIEEFYGADEYLIKLKLEKRKFKIIGRSNDKGKVLQIILKYLNDEGFDINLESFTSKIYNLYIYSYKNHINTPILKTGLIYHLNTELKLTGLGTFIYLDSKWYKLRAIFVKEMNSQCEEILQSNILNNSILDELWERKSNGKRENESSYNEKYYKDDYLVLDTITIDSIELADVIYIQENTVHLCHIKYGFSTDLRELYSQIISSSRRLKNDLKDLNNDYLKSTYDSLVTKKRDRGLTQDEFINIFKTKDIKYVMGITSHIKGKSVQNSIEKYRSNIAKLSLIQCFTEMRTEYYDLSFELINNDLCFNN
jgi:uncharacterized protein (TIGR04141 family)